uniref:Spaetzle domain-containing protein n=2 Tax=Timema TaxID=61471 RepID=A0A7R8VV03_TIMDO|nr:unnamed protein product [Timema douglasi]
MSIPDAEPRHDDLLSSRLSYRRGPPRHTVPEGPHLVLSRGRNPLLVPDFRIEEGHRDTPSLMDRDPYDNKFDAPALRLLKFRAPVYIFQDIRERIELFIDENKALMKRMYGEFQMSTEYGPPRESRRTNKREAPSLPGVPDLHGPPVVDPATDKQSGESYFSKLRQTRQSSSFRNNQSSESGRVDACESKVEIVTPYWASNSAGKIRAIVNTQHFEQAIHQEVCSYQLVQFCNLLVHDFKAVCAVVEVVVKEKDLEHLRRYFEETHIELGVAASKSKRNFGVEARDKLIEDFDITYYQVVKAPLTLAVKDRLAETNVLPALTLITPIETVGICKGMLPIRLIHQAKKALLHGVNTSTHLPPVLLALLQSCWEPLYSKVQTKRCSGDCGCEQKYKWHRLLAYDPDNDCKGIFMDWFLFPSCCVCRCEPTFGN